MTLMSMHSILITFQQAVSDKKTKVTTTIYNATSTHLRETGYT